MAEGLRIQAIGRPLKLADRSVADGLADGLGFEPKTALRLYSISSAAPSTGLGHPSSPGKSTGAPLDLVPSPELSASRAEPRCCPRVCPSRAGRPGRRRCMCPPYLRTGRARPHPL